ncbi:MAG: diguanylate cyclase [Anaerotignum sp.]|nr:diguanylate cyclase [Anaerotignum sp.]
MKKRYISMRKIIIFTFVFLMLASVSFIGNMVFSNWIASTNKITQTLASAVNWEITEQINNFMNVPKHVNEVNEKLIQRGIVNLASEEERDKYFLGVIQAHQNEIYSFTYGMENGEYCGARRNENGEIQIVDNNSDTGGSSWYYHVNEDLTRGEVALKTDKFDPRTRDWYIAAKKLGTSTFSPVYQHFVMKDLTISTATPIYDDEGKLLGVLGTHTILHNINHYMQEVVNDYDGYAVVLEKDSNTLIANSFDGENFTILEDGSFRRNEIDDLNNELISAMVQKYNTGQEDAFQFSYQKRGYYVNAVNYQNDGLDWVIISAIPNNLFTKEIYDSMRLTVLIILLTLLLIVLIYFGIIKWIFKPIDALVLVSNEIAAGNLSMRATRIRNDEIGELSLAFNFMADRMFQLVNNLEDKVKDRTCELEFANEELNRTKDNLSLILDTTAEGILGIALTGKCIFCNDSCIKLLGYASQEDILGKNILNLIYNEKSNEGSQEGCKILRAIQSKEKVFADDEVFWKADGTKINVAYHSRPKLKGGTIIGAVVTFIDITDKKKDEEQIKYLSSHDSLTRLLNRRGYEDKSKQYDNPSFFPISIIFGDLNGLKLMNDVFGHAAGDMLIQKTAEVLNKVCQNEDIIARVGGDEFIVLLPKTGAAQTIRIMEQIKSEMSNEKVFDIKCSIAIGFDAKIDASQNIEAVMGNAEREMYKDKLLSKRNYSIDTIQSILKILYERDPREKEHTERVVSLCQKMGKAMGLAEHEQKRLNDVGHIHGIGKIVLDEHILKKTALNEKEKYQLQQHPVVGYRILNLFDNTLDFANDVYAQNEKWDGTGIPKGLRGEEIPLISRVVAIIEGYEEELLKNENSPRESKKLALEEIQKRAGKDFDPKLIELFLKIMEETV